MDSPPFPEMVGGDWIDYIHDLCQIVYEYRPRTMLELGCGALHGAKAVFSYGTIQGYVGVDWRAAFDILDHVPKVWPTVWARIIREDIHRLDLGLLEGQAFDCALVDAHQGSENQHSLDHLKQIEIVDHLRIPLVIVDDCRIQSVGNAHLAKWGQPTGKGKGVTGLWWWKR